MMANEKLIADVKSVMIRVEGLENVLRKPDLIHALQCLQGLRDRLKDVLRDACDGKYEGIVTNEKDNQDIEKDSDGFPKDGTSFPECLK